MPGPLEFNSVLLLDLTPSLGQLQGIRRNVRGVCSAQVCNWKSRSWRQAQQLGSERRRLWVNEEVGNAWVIRSGGNHGACSHPSAALQLASCCSGEAQGRSCVMGSRTGSGAMAQPGARAHGHRGRSSGAGDPRGTWPGRCARGWHRWLRATSGWAAMSPRTGSAQPGLPVPVSDRPHGKTAEQNSRAQPLLGLK